MLNSVRGTKGAQTKSTKSIWTIGSSSLADRTVAPLCVKLDQNRTDVGLFLVKIKAVTEKNIKCPENDRGCEIQHNMEYKYADNIKLQTYIMFRCDRVTGSYSNKGVFLYEFVLFVGLPLGL